MRKHTKMPVKFEKEMVCWLSNYETNTNSKCTNCMEKHSMRNKTNAFVMTQYDIKFVTVMMIMMAMMIIITIIMSFYNKNVQS